MYALTTYSEKLTNTNLRLSEQCVFGIFHWGSTDKHSAWILCTFKAQFTLFLLPESATSHVFNSQQ